MTDKPIQTNRTKLLQVLKSLFSESELREICFDLGVEYADLPAVERAGKARELILYLERVDRLPELLEVCQRKRPNFPWQAQSFWAGMDTDASQITADAPYKGMAYFDEADAHLFFGREALTAELITLLDSYPFLAVVGASGSGKSSVVRAGVVPVLKGNSTAADAGDVALLQESWQIIMMTPTDKPLRELATVLTTEVDSNIATTRLMDEMMADGRSLDVFMHKVKRNGGQNGRFLIIVDQFEELFTLCRDEDQRRMFIENLVTAVTPQTGGSISLIITLRADFYANCSQYEGLRNALETHQKYIGAMNWAEIQRAIEEPVKPNWTFEPGLVEMILRDVGATETKPPDPGALPLLSHALLETWRRREGDKLTFSGYVAAGGVHGAIAETAQREFDNLTPDQQTIARNIFLRLTELGAGTEDTRRRASMQELIPDAAQADAVNGVLQTLVNARLLTTGDNEVEVSHEALIREWPTLRTWLDSDRAGLKIQRDLTEATSDWLVNEHNKSYLYQGLRLDEAERWAESPQATLNSDEQAFLQASLLGRQVRKLWRVAAVVAVILVILLFAVTQTNSARTQSNIASTAQAESTRAFIAEGNAQVQTTRAVAEANRANAESTKVVQQAATTEAEKVRADESANIANARLLVAQGQSIHAEDPMLGLALVLEGISLVNSGNADLTIPESVFQEGRVQNLENNVEQIIQSPDELMMIIDHINAPGEVRQTADGALLTELAGDVTNVTFSTDEAASIFVVDYSDAASEVRQMADGALLTELAGDVRNVTFRTDEAASIFVVDYYWDAPDEIRQTADGALLTELAGEVDWVTFSPDEAASIFVVDYYSDAAGEVRQTADGALLTDLAGEVDWVTFSTDEAASIFVVDYLNAPGELRQTADGALLTELAGDVRNVTFSTDEAASIFVVAYWDAAGEVRQTADGALLTELAGEVYQVIFSTDEAASIFVVDYLNAPGELRQTADGALLTELAGDVRNVTFSPDEAASIFVVDYVDAPIEIRQTADGALLTELAGDVRNVTFSPDEAASIFVVDYVGAPDELRQTADGALLTELAGIVTNVTFSTDEAASIFVVAYADAPGEIRQTADGALLTELAGEVDWVTFSPDETPAFILASYFSGESELFDFDSLTQLAKLNVNMADASDDSEDEYKRHAIFSADNHGLTLLDNGGQAYFYDLAWLRAMGGRGVDEMEIDELVEIACAGPMSRGWLDQDKLLEYLNAIGIDKPQACQ